MQTQANHYTFLSLLTLTILCITCLPQTVTSEKLSCYKVFRKQYSLFFVRNMSVAITHQPLTMMFNGHTLKGTLLLDFCTQLTLVDYCGVPKVTGNFIFKNESKNEGEPICLVFSDTNQDNWDYSTFKSDSEIVAMNGVRLLNGDVTITPYGVYGQEQHDVSHVQTNSHKLRLLTNNSITTKLAEPMILNVPQVKHYTKEGEFEEERAFNIQRKNTLQVPTKKHSFSYVNDEEDERQVIMNLRKKLGKQFSHGKVIVDKDQNKTVDNSLENDNDLVSHVGTALKHSVTLSVESIEDKDNKNTNFRILAKEKEDMFNFDNLKDNALNAIKEQASDIKNNAINVVKEEASDIKNNAINVVKDKVGHLMGDNYNTEVNFFCDNSKTEVMTHYLPTQRKLQINVYSTDGCIVEFEFLQLLNEFPILTGLVFAVIGVCLAFLGIKVYKNLLVIFIPMMVAILGFYLYFAIVENATTSTTKILTMVGLLVIIMVLVVLMIWFNYLIYFLVSFTVSYQCGLILKGLGEHHIEFFTKPYTEWIIIACLFILFTILYIVAKDFFLIMATAIMGSLFTVISFKYFGFTDYDFLFDTQIEKFREFENLDPETQKMTLIFCGILIIGIITQFILLRKEHALEKTKEMESLHDKPHGIQLENI